MQFRDGNAGQKALFAILVATYLAGLAIAIHDKQERVGRPDPGFTLDGANVSPTRWDAAAAGVWGGGQALTINGVAVEHGNLRTEVPRAIVRTPGATNRLALRLPGGTVADVVLPVRAWEWGDVLFAEGTTLGLGILFAVVGLASFFLRPYTPSSWALLALCTISGGMLSSLFLDIGPNSTGKELYFRLMVGLMAVVPFHAALAFPVVHPTLLRPRVVAAIYTLGLSVSALQLQRHFTSAPGFLPLGGELDTTLLLVSMLCVVGRCSWLAWKSRDPLVAQRARILVAGAVAGVLPLAVVNFLRNSFGILLLDMRVAYSMVAVFLLALGYVTVRHDLLNARIAVRRAVIYAAVVVVLTAVAVLLVAVRSYAVGLLLLPLLYWWPRFDAFLNARLYPKRTRFAELLRTLGNEMLNAAGEDRVLNLLAEAPTRLCDARSCVAFLLTPAAGPGERLGTHGFTPNPGPPLADEILVQLMRATRREIRREHIAVEPQYSNIQNECHAGFERLGADLLLPIVREDAVAGGLAIGGRSGGDPYEAAEVDALLTVTQQAVQALARIEATERLRVRERDFADLKRFFPPQIIDQVMARGGAAELRSQRRLVTVLFADLRGFTSFSDSVEPEEVMATLAEYHAAVGRRIAEFAGTVERFSGDGIMVFFNDPVAQPDHVERAVRMAVAIRLDMRGLRDGWLRKGYRIDVGMGIHTGYATCGFIGFEGRRDYGVIGNVTNLAARLCDAAAADEILISDRVRSELPADYAGEPAGVLTLKGFHAPQAAYRLG